MKIQWFGQSCFGITSQSGLKLITDPYQTGLSPRFLYAPVNPPPISSPSVTTTATMITPPLSREIPWLSGMPASPP